MVGVVLFGAEGQAPHGGVQAVRPDDEVEGARRRLRELHPHSVLVLLQGGDGVAEEVLDVRAGVLVDHPHQVLAQHLDVLAVQPAAAEGRLGRAADLAAVGAEDRHAAHPGADAARPLQQPHALHHVERDTADVHGLPAAAHARGAFDDGGLEAVAVQEVGEDGTRDAAAGDQYGPHEKLLQWFVRCTQTECTTYTQASQLA